MRSSAGEGLLTSANWVITGVATAITISQIFYLRNLTIPSGTPRRPGTSTEAYSSLCASWEDRRRVGSAVQVSSGC
ncbi:hypothetical protein BD310DRAFT_171082 [Dichomitus squalens]|uniref:Uncharacterized protein n=1 Tax=Dichomitus squalens TaxID=114155 RepID=A0A4V2K8W3_9APHY|nr:hypothetical protein BD310DRAFT_171082 [Dichomitus squalens]